MKEPESIHAMRRKAPLHFLAKADNARFVAYLLHEGTSEETLSAAAKTLPYGGTPAVAVREAFHREAALALELIVKAVIAQKLELGNAPEHVTRVKPVHDLPGLWQDAELPKPSVDQQMLLVRARRILNWSGRYAAPRRDEQFDTDQAELDALGASLVSDPTRAERSTLLHWDTFEPLYTTAFEAFWELRG